MSTTSPGLNYRDPNPAGDPAVLLLHGLGATGDCWGYQVPALIGAGCRPIAVDLPGFGRSPWTGDASPAAMARSAIAVLDRLGIEKAHVAGISMGGTVALRLALDRPERVDRLALVSTFASLKPSSPSGWLVFVYRLFLVTFVGMPSQARFVAGRLFPHPGQDELRLAFVEQFMQADPRAYRAAILALSRFNELARLGQVRAPTLVVTGPEDKTVAPANQQQLLAIPGARHVVIEGAGHGVIADHPAEFNEALLAFLGRAAA